MELIYRKKILHASNQRDAAPLYHKELLSPKYPAAIELRKIAEIGDGRARSQRVAGGMGNFY